MESDFLLVSAKTFFFSLKIEATYSSPNPTFGTSLNILLLLAAFVLFHELEDECLGIFV